MKRLKGKLSTSLLKLTDVLQRCYALFIRRSSSILLVCSDSSNWKPNRIQEISKAITNNNILFCESVGFFYWQSFGLKLEIKCKMLRYFSLVQRAVFSANRTSHFWSAEVLPAGSSRDINSNSKSALTKLKCLFGSVAPSLGEGGEDDHRSNLQ